MNERIKELAEQAKQYARAQFAHTMEPGLFSAEVFQEKFAELIIKECARVIDRVYETSEPDHGCYDWATWAYGSNILEHFGIE